MGTTARELYERGRDASNAQRYAAARRLLERASARATDAGADLQSRIAGTMAYVLAQTGEAARAEALCREALDRDGVSAETQAIVAGQLGLLFTRAGRLDDADEMLTRAITSLSGTARANCLLNRSLVHMHRRAFAASTADLEQAVTIYEAEGDAAAAAEARHNLGYTALLRGDLVEALELMARSRPVIAAGSPEGAAMSDLDRAEVLRDAGLVDEAERLLDSVATTFGAARMRQSQAEAEYHLARSLVRHDPARAEGVARSAARRFRALGAESWAARSDAIRLDARLARTLANDLRGGRSAALPAAAEFAATVETLSACGFPAEATAVRFSAALAADQRGEPDAAERLPRLARDSPTPLRLRAAEVRAARAQAHGRSTEARRHAAHGLDLLSDWQRSFGALDLQVSLAMHGTGLIFRGLAAAGDSRDPAILFDWSERARHLSQQVAPVRPPRDGHLADDLATLRMLRTDLSGTEWTTDPRVRALRDRVRDRQWTETGAGDLRPRVTLDELRASLDPDTAVLSYVFTGASLLCLVTTADASRIVDLDWPDVKRASDGLRADLDVSAAIRSGPMAEVVARALDDRMLRLDEALLGPLRIAIGTRRLVLTVPGLLAGIPWAMLPTNHARPFTLATSVSRWMQERPTAAPMRSVGFVGGPRVPRAVEEVHAAASAWPDPAVLIGENARVDAVTDLAGRVDLLHIAAHGHHAVDNPLFAGFELADGTLFGYDVDLIPHPPETVVLSACELGHSSVRWGEEALGMTRVWLHAGTRSVIAAPAVVSDDIASTLLAAVHLGLSRDESPAVALAAASEATGHRTPFQCHGSGF
ncbi:MULTISPECIES: CHAT domain-containing protein [Microbacterium]|uniref:CHAT domain-containing protein n=1 Tax=Microbacterium TaxID=33882 RepID=UPI00051A33B6|nr:CHAT domain-containing protein [Microbacterium profundi]